MNLASDYIKTSNVYHTEIVNGNKIIDEKKIEYETPFEKKTIGIKNGKKYSYFRKKPKHVTFRLKKRSLTPYYKNKKKYNKDCKTTRKIK